VLGVASLLAALCAGGTADAQEVPREEYLAQLPLSTPRLVPGSPASRGFSLFGDRSEPGYRDVDPVDGNDDARAAVLMALGVRFAPFPVQNTGDFPTDFGAYVRNRASFPLFVDTWDLLGADAELVESRAINLAALDGEACRGTSEDV
jgi:hypothetical protein